VGLLARDLKDFWSLSKERFRIVVMSKVLVGGVLVALTIPITLSPHEVMAGWHNWAVMNSKVGKTDVAVSSYLRVLKVDPSHRPSLSNLSRVEFSQGNLDKSEYLSNRLTNQFPDSYVGWTNLADIFLKRRKFNTAINHAKKALAIRPQNRRAQISLAKAAFLAEDYQAACPLLNKLMQVSVRDSLIISFHRSCQFVSKK
jgi:Tfp pilus assembly protein PilF